MLYVRFLAYKHPNTHRKRAPIKPKTGDIAQWRFMLYLLLYNYHACFKWYLRYIKRRMHTRYTKFEKGLGLGTRLMAHIDRITFYRVVFTKVMHAYIAQ